MLETGLYLDPSSAPPDLKAALGGFLGLLELRNGEIPGQLPFPDVLRSVEAWLAKGGRTASTLANLTWLINSDPPSRDRALGVAVAYAIEADQACMRGETAVGWGALTQGFYYLGVASGAQTASERQVEVAKAKHEKEWGDQQRWVVKWLNEKAPLQFADRSEAVREMEVEYDLAFPDATGDLYERISSWARERVGVPSF